MQGHLGAEVATREIAQERLTPARAGRGRGTVASLVDGAAEALLQQRWAS